MLKVSAATPEHGRVNTASILTTLHHRARSAMGTWIHRQFTPLGVMKLASVVVHLEVRGILVPRRRRLRWSMTLGVLVLLPLVGSPAPMGNRRHPR